MTVKAPSDLEAALCLVLRANAYSEADYILTLFGRDEGLLSARAYGAKSLKSGVRAACQPFCVAEFEFYVRGSHRSVKAAAVRADFHHLQDDYLSYLCGCVILELTEKVLRYADEYGELFRLTVSCLAALNAPAGDPRRVLLFFLLRMTYLLGIFPVITSCAVCGARVPRPRHWSDAEGGTVCAECAEHTETAQAVPAVLHCLGRFGRGQLRDLPAEEATDEAVAGACRQLLAYLRAQYDITLRTAGLLPLSAVAGGKEPQ